MEYPSPFSEPATYGVYPLPKNNVVLLSCMDLRQIDELETFMARDNLVNRYDHLITAGAALGVMKHDTLDRKQTYTFGPQHKECGGCPPWRTTFFDHLDIALRLHQPHDVYIVEHRHCGAYKAFTGKDFPDEVTGWDAERLEHHHWAAELCTAIRDWYPAWRAAAADGKGGGQPDQLGVHAFLLDLRGNVELLFSHPPEYPPAEPPTKAETIAKRGPGRRPRA